MVDLLHDPEEYAKRAITAIEMQLETVVSTTRKAKLTNKLSQWKKALEILSAGNYDKKESDPSSES